MTNPTPSTTWKEIISPNEESIFEEYSVKLIEIQKEKSKKFGNGRALHRKQIEAHTGTLEILDAIPEHAKQGIFAKKGSYPVEIRLSNGSMEVKSNSEPDIRGFAIKVKNLSGKNPFGTSQTEQDFLLINQTTFSSPDALPFLKVVVAASKGPLSLLGHLFGEYGFFGGLQKIKSVKETFGKPFSGYYTENFSTVAPMAFGKYAGKLRIKPRANNTKENAKFDVQIQFFINESETPIENASIEWQEQVSPFVTVGELSIDKGPANKDELEKKVETSKFDPWNCLEEHKPLGNIMRCRKVMYLLSQKGRGV